jgi:hypothetical protein
LLGRVALDQTAKFTLKDVWPFNYFFKQILGRPKKWAVFLNGPRVLKNEKLNESALNTVSNGGLNLFEVIFKEHLGKKSDDTVSASFAIGRDTCPVCVCTSNSFHVTLGILPACLPTYAD